MARRFIPVALVCVAAWFSISFMGKGADNSEPTAKAADHTFAGKYLEVNTKGRDGGGYLSDPNIRIVEGRSFLVGKAIAPNNRWKSYDGKTVWIAWKDITQITECDNLEGLKDLQN